MMAGKKVAVKDDVSATAGSSTTATSVPTATGSWQAGTPTFSEYEKLKLGNKKVIYQAAIPNSTLYGRFSVSY